MRNIFFFSVLLYACCACSLFEPSAGGYVDDGSDLSGTISVRFSGVAAGKVRSAAAILDTNSFIITVTGPDGGVLYDDVYYRMPEVLNAAPGVYTVRAVSSYFTVPAFDAPQWGDEQMVTVRAGENVTADLVCRLVNCGVRLGVSRAFIDSGLPYSFLLQSAEGSVPYVLTEKRTAYFLPGLVSLAIDDGKKTKVLLTRFLGAGEILDLGINAGQQNGSGSVSIKIDTSCTHLSETYDLDPVETEPGSSADNALDVQGAMAAVGRKDVWVGGYIVGGDLTKSTINFEGPFKSASNMAIGPRWSTSTRSSCLSVELKSGPVRDALNLVSNPDVLGSYVCLKGDIDPSYFGLIGIKNVTDYVLREINSLQY